MTTFPATALAVFLAVMLVWLAVPVRAADLPPQTFPEVCGTQLKTHNFTVEDIDKVHKMGFRFVRRGFYWNTVEKEKGKYDFSMYDKQMDHARKLGVRVVGCLFGGNKLYEDDGRGGIQTEEGRKGFAAFAAAAATHYKDHDVLWEIWNEPNVRTFWRKDGQHNSEEFAEEYTALVKAVTPAVLKADPKAFVMAGSVSNYWPPSYEWTEFCFKKGILKSGIRGWSVHPYGVKSPEEFAVGHGITRELLKKYGAPDMPMLNTERGFAVKKPKTQLELEGWSGGKEQRLREYQAWHFVRQYMVDQLHGVRLTMWYEWDGDAFGIVDEEGKRPVMAACRTMLEQLNGYKLVRRLESNAELDFVLLFENKQGARKLVAWTAPPAKASPDEAGEHDVSVHMVKSIKGTDLDGKSTTVPISTGSIQLTLTGAPQYVAVPEGIELGKCLRAGAAGAAPAKDEKVPDAKVADASAPPKGSVDLKLFEKREGWEFVKNTGDGSFEVGKDAEGKAIGTLNYDFTKSSARGTPYVLATVPVDIAEGAQGLIIHARSNVGQQLTFRLIDSTGQTHQYKGRIKGTGAWEAIRIPLTRRLEHWGGAKDGKKHFPIKSLVFSVPLPDKEHELGKVEYSDAHVVR